MSLSKGYVEKVTPVGWLASRIDRVARSPGAAEAKTTVSGEDMLFHARYQYGEFLTPSPNIFMLMVLLMKFLVVLLVAPEMLLIS